jgi:signal transduction histidine kinase
MRLAGDNLASGISVSPEQARRYGETIRRESDRLTFMVDQVLTFARSERPDWTVHTAPVQPEAVLEAALASAEPQLSSAGMEVVRDVDAGLRPVSADANLLASALTNILNNAAQYAASGKWVRVRAFAEDHDVVFEVSDRGPGLPAGDRRRVIEAFQRGTNSSSVRGAGLGLHLARRIAAAHGGAMTLDSDSGGGTVVRMKIPAAAAPLQERRV